MPLIFNTVPIMKRRWLESTRETKFDFVRLVLSGALVGVALVGAGFWLFGVNQSDAWSTVGGIAGVLAAGGLKAAHFC